MTEQELKNLISIYQQKVNDLMAQTIALEARLANSNQLIEALTNKIKELQEQKSPKKSTKSPSNSEDFT
jgi:CII-binding regulator of phage lambda lysogenization HflD